MEELSFVAQRSWLIISTCIVVVLSVGAIAVLIWWFVTNFTDYGDRIRKEVSNEENRRSQGFAAAADAGWEGYIAMKDKYNNTVLDYESKLDKMEEWDMKRIHYIDALRKQLRDNGIEPIEMEKTA